MAWPLQHRRSEHVDHFVNRRSAFASIRSPCAFVTDLLSSLVLISHIPRCYAPKCLSTEMPTNIHSYHMSKKNTRSSHHGPNPWPKNPVKRDKTIGNPRKHLFCSKRLIQQEGTQNPIRPGIIKPTPPPPCKSPQSPQSPLSSPLLGSDLGSLPWEAF